MIEITGMTLGIVDLILRVCHGFLNVSGGDGVVRLVICHVRVEMGPGTVRHRPAFAAFVPAALHLIGGSGAAPQETFRESSFCHCVTSIIVFCLK